MNKLAQGCQISVENLDKFFKVDNVTVHALEQINLLLEAGEIVSIVGSSGAGKSTLLHLIGALDQPTAGKILYDKEDVFAYSDNQRAAFRNANIGFVFQFHHLLPEFTALENVLMPLLIARQTKITALEKASYILEQVGLANRMLHKPGQLSGGEQQRVAVARALVTEPRVLLADEPTGNLDSQTGDSVFELIRQINEEKGISVILVTHNEKLADKTQRCIRLLDGKTVV